MTAMALCACFAVAAIQRNAIDDRAARGAGQQAAELPGFSALLRNPVLLITGLTLLLFHLGNAALLPMLGIRAAATRTAQPGVYTAATVVISQCVMIPVALFAARNASRLGFPLLITLALVVLPVRAGIASCSMAPMRWYRYRFLMVWPPGCWAWQYRATSSACLTAADTQCRPEFRHADAGRGRGMQPGTDRQHRRRWSYQVAFAVLGSIALAALMLWSLSQRIRWVKSRA